MAADCFVNSRLNDLRVSDLDYKVSGKTSQPNTNANSLLFEFDYSPETDPPLMDFSSPPPTALFFLNGLQGCASLNHICLTCRRESLIQPEPICYQKVP